MPRPRFFKLPRTRQEALLEAAAQEFAAHGFEDASLNQILERAGVSKGVAYYYFDDKEDLFLTVVDHYLARLGITNFEQFPETVTADTFWPSFAELYRRPFIRSREIPWSFGVWRAVSDEFHAKPGGELAAYINAFVDVLARLLKRGQALGVVRTDVADDLLIAWVRAVDDANDRWILDHWDELDTRDLAAAADRVVDGLWRLIGTDGNPNSRATHSGSA